MSHIKKSENRQKGQTLIEATVALASILLTLSAISIAVATSLSNSQFIKNQSLAGKYAQSGMELIRYLRNTDPDSFQTHEGIKCMNGDNNFEAGSCPGINIAGTFKREVEFTQNTIECGTNPDDSNNSGTKVVVSVYWISGKCDAANRFCHKSQLTSCFSKLERDSAL